MSWRVRSGRVRDHYRYAARLRACEQHRMVCPRPFVRALRNRTTRARTGSDVDTHLLEPSLTELVPARGPRMGAQYLPEGNRSAGLGPHAFPTGQTDQRPAAPTEASRARRTRTPCISQTKCSRWSAIGCKPPMPAPIDRRARVLPQTSTWRTPTLAHREWDTHRISRVISGAARPRQEGPTGKTPDDSRVTTCGRRHSVAAARIRSIVLHLECRRDSRRLLQCPRTQPATAEWSRARGRRQRQSCRIAP